MLKIVIHFCVPALIILSILSSVGTTIGAERTLILGQTQVMPLALQYQV